MTHSTSEVGTTYSYELDFISHWRMSRDQQRAILARFLLVASFAPLAMYVRGTMHWHSADFLLSRQFLRHCPELILIGAGIYFLINPLTTALTTAVARLTDGGNWKGTRTVAILPEGIHLTAPGLDTIIAWASILETRATRHTLLFRTATWLVVPRRAFDSFETGQRFYEEVESRRGTSATVSGAALAPASTENPYAAPAPVLPIAGHALMPPPEPDVLLRVVVPSEMVGRLSEVLNTLRARPIQLAPLGVVLLPALALRDPIPFFIAGSVSLLVLVMHGIRRRQALGGVSFAQDFAESGISEWSSTGTSRANWADILGAREHSDSFFIFSRHVTFHVPKRCLAPGQTEALRKLLVERVGARATVRSSPA